MDKILYSAKDIRNLTGLSYPTVYKMLHDPSMPVVRVGNRLFMHREKFIQKLAEMGTPMVEQNMPETAPEHDS